ncbi:exopolysaccharide biosynthesis polyprenyl glycosylphosphotransferase [Brachybacterium sp. p3-SID1565]|uniref:sugar transferase n=1 Tax=Brachybacterium sp. p3-SID1565 TaxID=2916046 RepID=UPI0021A45FA2|nr:exopolysaccharide biosynthesis polyprenyl glycosylphosphotransferase [Brachybacterium sp. p3-SID1565]MCT1386111.1 exopolysaccharide biosynthesis polyprenyl glycosylphosphotransferase [Brachybacterium sp. p3-SID1565]
MTALDHRRTITARVASIVPTTPWSPALRFEISATGLVLATAVLVAGTVARTADAPMTIWAWTGIWVLLTLLLGTRPPVRALRTNVEMPLMAGGLTLIGSVMLDQVVPVIPAMPAHVTLLVALSTLTAILRALLTGVCRPRSVELVLEGSGSPVPRRGRCRLPVRISPSILRDPVALARVVMVSVEQFDAEYVDLCPGIDPHDATVLAWELRTYGVSVRMPLSGIPVRGSRLSTVTDTDATLLVLAPPRQSLRVRLLKRTFDTIGAAVLLLMLSPLLLVVAWLIHRDDPGPIMFRQERVGLDGRTFRIWKFRTMCVDADARLAALLREQGRDGTPLFKVEDDPRITGPGRFLRRYSIDELPQLLNVLDGSMSLVGPRPQRPAEVALYTGHASHRLGVRPGMTGLWQVSGRSNLSWQKAQELDVFYAHNWSFAMDVAIIGRTVRAVLAADGAV